MPPTALTAGECAQLQAATGVHHCTSKLKVWPSCFQMTGGTLIDICMSISPMPSERSTKKYLIRQAEMILKNNNEIWFIN